VELIFFSVSRHLFLIPAKPGLGNMPGYYRPSLAGLVQFRLTRSLFLKKQCGVIESHASPKQRERMGHAAKQKPLYWILPDAILD
jgi:hypothetical protein